MSLWIIYALVMILADEQFKDFYFALLLNAKAIYRINYAILGNAATWSCWRQILTDAFLLDDSHIDYNQNPYD